MSLGTRVSRGLGWSLGGQLASRLLVFSSGVALARLLVPADFGDVAAGLAVSSLVLAINELGVIPAIVRTTDEQLPGDCATAASLAAVNSCFMYAVAFLVAPAVAELTNTPGSVPVIRLMSLSVLVDGAVAVPLAMLYRGLRIVPQVLAEVLGMVVNTALAVSLAMGGGGGLSMAWGRLAGSVVTGACIAAAGRWPARPGFDRQVARRLVAFGLPLASSSALLEAVLNVDYLIVGRQLSGSALGVYLLAFNLSSWPVSVLGVAIGRVSFASYSAVRHDRSRLARSFVYSAAVAVTFIVPMVLILVWAASDLVEVVYGGTWLQAVGPLRWLLLVGGLRVLLTMAGEVIAVVGRVRMVLTIRLLWLLVLPPALVAGAEFGGLSGVGVAHVAVVGVVVLPLVLWQLKQAGVDPFSLAAVLGRPVSAAAVASLLMWQFHTRLDPGVLRLAVVGGAGAVAYGLAVAPANPTLRTLLAQLGGSTPAGEET